MSFADDEAVANILFRQLEYKGIERLICAMATCTDMRVRKNIAILLAKGSKLPDVKDRITHFRGMQMLVELSSSL